MTYISNCYYIFKFLQSFVAIIFLFIVFDTTKLCGEFVNQKSVQQAASIHKCSELTLYHLTLQTSPKPVDFLKLPPTHLNHIQPAAFPIGPHCMNISLGSSFTRCFTRPMDPHQMIADRFAVPISFAFAYLALLVVHVCVQMPPEYNSCQYMCAIFGAITWMIVYMDMAILRIYWDFYWQCSNFFPQMPPIIDIFLLITATLILSCIVEVLYNREMMNAGCQITTVNNNKKKSKALSPVVNNNKGNGQGSAGGVTDTNNAVADVKKQMEVFTIGSNGINGGSKSKESTNTNNAVADVKKRMEVFTIAVRY